MNPSQLLEFKDQIRRASGFSGHKTDRQTRKLLAYMFTGTRGGGTRLRIIMLLFERPYNTHQMAQELGLDYKAVQHHLRVMEKNNLVSKIGEGYGVLYRISDFLECKTPALVEAIDTLERKMKYRKVYI